jgi:hypothetical protein
LGGRRRTPAGVLHSLYPRSSGRAGRSARRGTIAELSRPLAVAASLDRPLRGELLAASPGDGQGRREPDSARTGGSPAFRASPCAQYAENWARGKPRVGEPFPTVPRRRSSARTGRCSTRTGTGSTSSTYSRTDGRRRSRRRPRWRRADAPVSWKLSGHGGRARRPRKWNADVPATGKPSGSDTEHARRERHEREHHQARRPLRRDRRRRRPARTPVQSVHAEGARQVSAPVSGTRVWTSDHDGDAAPSAAARSVLWR